jgi:hypothetical protein
MFDELVASTTGTGGAGAVDAWTRVESAACARRLAAMVTMLDDAYAATGSADRDQWCLDNWGAVCAHIGAAQRITSGTASNLLIVATALRDRFPKVAARFLAGLIGYPLVRTIVTRGALVTDPDALRALDEALAEALHSWEPMSVDNTEQAIDAFIAQVDPYAVRRTQTGARGRSVDITVEEGSGLAAVFATLFTPDAKAFDARLNALADTVCPADPRTRDQRRADAMGALGHGADRLACLCDTDACPAADNPPPSGVVVYVIAHQDTLDGTDVPPVSDDPEPDDPEPDDPEPDDGSPDEPPVTDEDDSAEGESAGLDGATPPMFAKPLHELPLTEARTPGPGSFSNIRPAAIMANNSCPGRSPATPHSTRPSPRSSIPAGPPECSYTPLEQLAVVDTALPAVRDG